jgi:thioredoxin-like negative regulator of GroEL
MEENTDKVTLDLNLELEDYGPLIITEENFAKTIGKGVTFVSYSVPWSTHCKQLKPIWNSLATKFFGQKDIKIAKVDCAHHESLCNKQQVKTLDLMIISDLLLNNV